MADNEKSKLQSSSVAPGAMGAHLAATGASGAMTASSTMASQASVVK